jgi:DNA repair protein RecO (recombination protein O)
MQALKIDGLVVKRINYGEADRILTLLTEDGVLSVKAKGVRKAGAKLTGRIEVFSLIKAELARGRGDLWILTGAKLINNFQGIISDYKRLEVGARLLHLLKPFSELATAEIYEIILSSLKALEQGSDIDTILLWASLRQKALLGDGLNVETTKNGQPLIVAPRYSYDSVSKSFFDSDAGEFLLNDLKLLRLMLKSPLAHILKVGGVEEVVGRILSIESGQNF